MKRGDIQRTVAGLGAGIFLLYLGTTLWMFFNSYPIPEFALKLFSIGVALLVLISAFSLGALCCGLIKKKFPLVDSQDDPTLFHFFILMGLGLGLLSTVVLIAGWLLPGDLSSKVILIAFLLSILFVFQIRSTSAEFRKSFTLPSVYLFSLEGISFLIAAIGILFAFVTCFSPITYYDSLVYHLAIPSIYNQAGRILPIPSNLYSYFPQNMEMIHLYVMSLCKNIPADYAINLIDWVVSVMTGGVIYSWMVRAGWKKPASIALALWWSAPPVILMSVGGYVDVPLAFFTILAVLCFYESWKNSWEGGWLITSAIFCSLASSTKYTGGMTTFILGLFLVGNMIARKKVSLKKIFMFGGFCLFPFGFWLLKNLVFVGNPVFPFLYDSIGAVSGWGQDNAAGYFQMLMEYGYKSNLFLEMTMAPWRIATSGLPFGGGMDVLGDFGWGLFLYSFFLSVFFLNKNRPAMMLFGYGMAHFLIWSVSKPVLRFLVGGMPVFVILSALTFHHLMTSKKGIQKVILICLAVPWLISNFFITSLLTSEIKSLTVALGGQTYNQFMGKRLPYYSAYQLLNGTLGTDQKVIILGEQRTYHLHVPFLASNIFAPSQLALWANESKNPEGLLKLLRENGITHLLINGPELDRLGGVDKFGFTTEGNAILLTFLSKKTILNYAQNGINIYTISK